MARRVRVAGDVGVQPRLEHAAGRLLLGTQTPTRYDNMVDSCTIIRTLGQTAYMVPGNRGNIKVTTPEDVYMYRALLTYKENEQAFGLGLTSQLESKIGKYSR